MKRILIAVSFIVILLASNAIIAAEKTVKLAVENMYCASCPYIVKKSLEKVGGVSTVSVSYADKTATVTFDNIQASVSSLTAATGDAGYPSSLSK